MVLDIGISKDIVIGLVTGIGIVLVKGIASVTDIGTDLGIAVDIYKA